MVTAEFADVKRFLLAKLRIARANCVRESPSNPPPLVLLIRSPLTASPSRHGPPGGECSPTARRARRKFTSAGQFRCSAVTVARQVAVRPSMRRKSAPQAKWRCQRWRRGWNRGTDRPLCGSAACVLAYLWPLHAGHAQAKSAAELPAPRTRGTTCSQTNGAQENPAGCRQYSQRSPARSRTCRRTARAIA